MHGHPLVKSFHGQLPHLNAQDSPLLVSNCTIESHYNLLILGSLLQNDASVMLCYIIASFQSPSLIGVAHGWDSYQLYLHLTFVFIRCSFLDAVKANICYGHLDKICTKKYLFEGYSCLIACISHIFKCTNCHTLAAYYLSTFGIHFKCQLPNSLSQKHLLDSIEKSMPGTFMNTLINFTRKDRVLFKRAFII